MGLRRKVSASEREQIKGLFRDSFIRAKAAGKTNAQAEATATAAVKERFGAIDFATLLAIFMQLLPLLLELFKK